MSFGIIHGSIVGSGELFWASFWGSLVHCWRPKVQACKMPRTAVLHNLFRRRTLSREQFKDQRCRCKMPPNRVHKTARLHSMLGSWFGRAGVSVRGAWLPGCPGGAAGNDGGRQFPPPDREGVPAAPFPVGVGPRPGRRGTLLAPSPPS